jgi:hypothetical protein
VRSGLPVLLAACGLVLTAGCSGDAPADRPAASRPEAAPSLGGPADSSAPPPRRAMNRLERPVQQRLASQLAGQGLTLEYLDCPRWDGTLPSRMTCRGYVDGVVARVAVQLKAAVAGKAVGFDAELLDGVIATRNLESTLQDQGWTDPDCGSTAAYPARVGSRIVCRVRRRSEDHYVVATVSSPAGTVMIAGYRSGEPAS